jgi:hypothetical protein
VEVDRMSRQFGGVVAVLCAVLVAGCTGHDDAVRGSASSSGTATPSQGPTAAAGCSPASPIRTGGMGPEVQGNGQGATLYGLIMLATPLPIRTGQEVKIVWRMTGSGPLRLSATSPQGRAVALRWGPEPHGGSNYERPGEEWGAGYLFGSAGCWHLRAQRTQGSADVWLRVQQ